VSQARKHRGAATERLVAERLRVLWPHATVVRGNGPDLENTPGAAVEIKARANVTLPAFMRQAAKNAKTSAIMPVLVLRLNGQGPASIDDWPVVIRLADFVDLWGDE
jgi:hypothetical protein